jgi:hypothetical protein
MGMRMTPESQSGLMRVEFVDLRKRNRESSVYAEYDGLHKATTIDVINTGGSNRRI